MNQHINPSASASTTTGEISNKQNSDDNIFIDTNQVKQTQGQNAHLRSQFTVIDDTATELEATASTINKTPQHETVKGGDKRETHKLSNFL